MPQLTALHATPGTSAAAAMTASVLQQPARDDDTRASSRALADPARKSGPTHLALGYVGRKELVSAAKAQRELGWTMRPVRESVIDTARTMIEHGIVPAR